MKTIEVPEELVEKFENKLFKYQVDFHVDPNASTDEKTTYVVDDDQKKRARDFLRKLRC